MKKLKIKQQNIPAYISVGLFILLFIAGSLAFNGFFSITTIINLIIDNSFLMIIAFGLTMVIISGGIDLSVGSIIALTCVMEAALLQKGWNPIVVILLALVIGTFFGLFHGFLVTYCGFQPFIATLSGSFIARGTCFLITTDTINITDPLFTKLALFRLKLPGGIVITVGMIITILVLLFYFFLLKYTKFGRNVYALGGNESSSRLMGLPTNRTKMCVYILNGTTAAIAGFVFSLYMLSGYGQLADGMHMDGIAAAVIGGTLMTGGVGSVFGTMFGVWIIGIIQTIITFQGSLSSWWTRIFIGALLCLFIVIQRVFLMRQESKKTMRSVVILPDSDEAEEDEQALSAK